MSQKITDKVTFVGKIDWTLKQFHGDQLSTNRGSTYNSFIIQDGKNVLIDTVWESYCEEFIEDVERTIGIKNLDCIVALHGEPDHSGAIKNILEKNPNIPIYCTANGVKSLSGYYHKEWNFHIVKTGDKLDLGNGSSLTFVEVPMLHWPDQMMAYYDSDQILFSSDPFGMHFASDLLFENYHNLPDLYYEALKYYANIVAPYSKKVLTKIEELKSLNFPIKMIAPAHGIIWKNPNYIIEKYELWANSYQENKITIVYDTMYESTRKMAEAIAAGIRATAPEIRIAIHNTSTGDVTDCVTDTFTSKAILVGSPTYNSGMLNSVAGFIDEITGSRLSNKKAAAFGSYGWAPGATKNIIKRLTEANFELFEPNSITLNWNPDEDGYQKCFDFGKNIAEKCK
jgi:flavorubredoxin